MAGPVLQLKVTLRGSKPPIWRRLLVPAGLTLAQFHDVLQIVMGWTDSHLHQFVFRGAYYGPPDPALDAERLDERQVRIGALLGRSRDRLLYEYDFGDGWEHDVVVEKVLPAAPGARYPAVVTGKRACPPEDCGGLYGYYDLLEALADPKNEEHDEVAEWLGRPFDPEAFDVEEVNRRLA